MIVHDNGTPVNRNALTSWIKRAQRRGAMVPDGKIHILRHTFCSRLAMRGVPVKAIQELAGHAALSTTMRYLHLSPAVRREAIRALESPLGVPGRGDPGEAARVGSEIGNEIK